MGWKRGIGIAAAVLFLTLGVLAFGTSYYEAESFDACIRTGDCGPPPLCEAGKPCPRDLPKDPGSSSVGALVGLVITICSAATIGGLASRHVLGSSFVLFFLVGGLIVLADLVADDPPSCGDSFCKQDARVGSATRASGILLLVADGIMAAVGVTRWLRERKTADAARALESSWEVGFSRQR